jgi:hypothetical protein
MAPFAPRGEAEEPSGHDRHYQLWTPIRSGQRTLIVGHGNSLRALVKVLDRVSDTAIVDLNIPIGVPLVYELDRALRPITHSYLGGPDTIHRSQGPSQPEGWPKDDVTTRREAPWRESPFTGSGASGGRC